MREVRMGEKILKKLKITPLLNRVLGIRHKIPLAIRRREARKILFFAIITAVLVFILT
jgi:hypothetical protein